MTLALGLFVAAALIGTMGPIYLRSALRPTVRPGLALAGWISSIVLMVMATVVSAVLLVLPRAPVLDGLIGMANSCINLIRADGEVVWEHVIRLGSAAVLFATAGWVVIVAVHKVRRHHQWRRHHLTLLQAVCLRADGDVLWMKEDKPVAYSVGGRHGCVVATSGVAALRVDERDAILAHEHAHLRGRHHLLVLVANIMSTALPFVPLCRRAPATIKILVELAADAAAAREHGTGPVRSALLTVSGYGTPRIALAMSRDAVDARLCWLTQQHNALRWLPARLDYAVAAALSLTPALLSTALVALAVLAYCLGTGSL